MASKKVYTASDGTRHKTTSQANAERLAGKLASEPKRSSSSKSKSSINVITDPVTGKSFSRDTSDPSSVYKPYDGGTNAPTTLTSANTAPTTPLNIPPPPTPSKTGTEALNTAAATAAGAAAATTAETDSLDDEFKDYMKQLSDIASGVDTEKLYDRTTRQFDLKEKKALVNNLTGQLNAITAQADAQKLALIGQGRGVTEAIIGGQQAQIDREAAIRALPISAQLSAAQADLASATDQVNTLFKIRVEDAQNKRDYKREVATAVWNYASDKQKQALAKKEKEEDRAFDMKVRNIEFARGLAEKAIANGQPSLAARLMSLDHNTANYETQIANLASGIAVSRGSSGGSSSSGSGSSVTQQVLDGFTKMSDLTPSQRQKVRDELYGMGFGASNPPSWFKEFIEDELQMNLTGPGLADQWARYKSDILSEAGGDELDFENL